MGMEVTGLCLENIEELWIDPLEYKDILREAVLHNNRQLMNVSIYNIPLCLIHKDIWSFSRQSISPWKNVYLPPDTRSAKTSYKAFGSPRWHH